MGEAEVRVSGGHGDDGDVGDLLDGGLRINPGVAEDDPRSVNPIVTGKGLNPFRLLVILFEVLVFDPVHVAPVPEVYAAAESNDGQSEGGHAVAAVEFSDRAGAGRSGPFGVDVEKSEPIRLGEDVSRLVLDVSRILFKVSAG